MTTPTPAELAAKEICDHKNVIVGHAEMQIEIAAIISKHLATTRKAAIEECVTALKAVAVYDEQIPARTDCINKLQSLLK